MTALMVPPDEEARVPDSAWKTVYRAGALAAFAVLLLIPIQMVVYFLWPPPESALEWFELFQDKPLVGLLDMDLLLIVDFVLLGLTFLALSAALWRRSPSLSSIAFTAEVTAVSTYMASITPFEMLSASQGYASASTELERTAYLTVGEALMATWQGTAFDVSYILAGAALLLVSIAMLRSSVFTRLGAYAGILAGVFALIPPTIGTIGLILSLLSLIPTVVWLAFVARSLQKLGWSKA